MRTHTYSFLLFTLLASLFTLLNSCSGCKGEDGVAGDSVASTIFDHITEEQLAKHKPTKHFEQNGYSKAFKLRPRKEMRITARKGAFETDPDIRVTDVDEEQVQQLEQLIAKQYGRETHLFMAYDVDCGLPFDSVIPGVYNIDVNLKALDVPENLWPYIAAYRSDGNGRLQMLSPVISSRGVLRYEARQNSIVMLGIGIGSLGPKLVVAGAAVLDRVAVGGTLFCLWNNLASYNNTVSNRIATTWEALGLPKNWWKFKDWVTLEINDTTGNFFVHFRYSKTENGAKAREMVNHMGDMAARAEELKGEARQTFNRDFKNNKAYRARLEQKARAFSPNKKILRTLFIKRREKMTIDSIYYASLENDEKMKVAEEFIPQSIRDVINGMRLAQRFCQTKDGLALKRLPYQVDIYVVPFKKADDSKAKAYLPSGTGGFTAGVLEVNTNLMYKTAGSSYSYDTAKGDEMAVSMAHEISHLYEYTYIDFPTKRDNRFIECIGSVSEYWFAQWLWKHKMIGYDPHDGKHEYLFADRMDTEVLAWPLTRREHSWPELFGSKPDIGGGYMLADFFDVLCEKTGRKPSFDHVMNQYANSKTLAQNFMDVFGITKEGELQRCFEEFCKRDIDLIVTRQLPFSSKQEHPQLFVHDKAHECYRCVMRVKNIAPAEGAEPLAIKTFKITGKEPNKGWVNNVSEGTPIYFNLFAVPSPEVKSSQVKFTFLSGEAGYMDEYQKYQKGTLEETPDPWFLKSGKEKTYRNNYAAIILRPGIRNAVIDDDYYIDLVAFYPPMRDPKVEGPSKDGTGLMVDTRQKADDDELLDHGYVSGMQLAVINHQTGKSKTFNIPLSKCGKTVKIDYAKIGVKDKDDIDVSVRTRWFFNHPNGKRYFSPATDRVHYQKKQKQEQQKKEEVKPDEEEIKTRNDEEVDEDNGDINKYFILTTIPNLPSYLGLIQNNNVPPVRTHFVVKDGKFRFDVPAHTLSWREGYPKGEEEYWEYKDHILDCPAITVTGEVGLHNPPGGWVYLFEKQNATFTPSHLRITHKEIRITNKKHALKTGVVWRQERVTDMYTYDLSLEDSAPIPEKFQMTAFNTENGQWGSNLDVQLPAKMKTHYVRTWEDDRKPSEQTSTSERNVTICNKPE